MKKLVLFVCLLPCLSFARPSSDHFSKIFGATHPKTSSLRAAASTLDSIYTYQGEENRLTDIEYHTYDASGRLIKEERKLSRGFDGDLVLSSKTEYSYPENPGTGRYETEEKTYRYDNGQWTLVSKTLNGYATATATQIYMRSYLFEDGKWKKDWIWEAVEYTDEGYPSLVVDSTFHSDGSVDVMRMDAVYDGRPVPSEGSMYGLDEKTGEWIAIQRNRMEYNDEGNILSQYAELLEDGEWGFGFEYTYQYDERGNVTHETDREADGTVFLIRYRNFYSDRLVTHNQTLQAAPDYTVRIHPASRVLEVNLGEATEGQVAIINAAGTTVYRQTLHSSLSSLPLNSFSTGFYIIHIYTPAGEASHQVVIR